MVPLDTLQAFDSYLSTRELRLEATVIGGTALNLLGIIDRPTRDVDVLEPVLSAGVLKAARDFAVELQGSGEMLAADWLNNGPRGLVRDLPDGWSARVEPLFNGRAVILRTLCRADLLKTKLFALCDRGTDWGDCVALQPTRQELDDAAPWVILRDANPRWPQHVVKTLNVLCEAIEDGV